MPTQSGRIQPITALPTASDFAGVNQDFATLLQNLNDRFRRIDNLIPSGASASALIIDTHAHRTNYAAGSYKGYLYFETDRGLVYVSMPNAGGQNSYAWSYVAGVLQTTQAAIAGLALGANDKNLLANVTDYGHLLQWSGSQFGWGPGEVGSGFIQLFAYAPSPTTGWHLCDGTASVKYLLSTGALSSGVTLPNLNGSPAYPKMGGSYTGTINAAGNTGSPSATTTVASGSGATVASSSHTHAMSGDPANLVLLPYFRL